MFVIKYRKIFYAFTALLVILSLYGLFAYGLRLGIDFKGGVIAEVDYASAPDLSKVMPQLDALNIGDYTISPTNGTGVILRTPNLSDAQRTAVMNVLDTAAPNPSVKSFDSVGPILGAELQKKSLYAIIMVIVAIVLFITFAFRKVSKPISSWKYGIVAIIALIHDVLIPVGFFTFFGHIYGIEVDSLFVTAILVVLGFSVHDTIVVFDRTRENLQINETARNKKDFETLVGESLNQTFIRSINTSLTVVISLLVLYFIGPVATQDFSLALLVGIIAGTYSSIFLGSPLLVTLQLAQDKKEAKK